MAVASHRDTGTQPILGTLRDHPAPFPRSAYSLVIIILHSGLKPLVGDLSHLNTSRPIDRLHTRAAHGAGKRLRDDQAKNGEERQKNKKQGSGRKEAKM